MVIEDTSYGQPPPLTHAFAAQVRQSQDNLRKYYRVSDVGCVLSWLLVRSCDYLSVLVLCAFVTWSRMSDRVIALLRASSVEQDMSFWVLGGEVEGVRHYTGTGKMAAARGDGIIPFPAR